MTDKLHRENKPDQPLSILTLNHVPPDEERAEMERQLDTALIIRFRESLSLANRVRMENPPGDWIEQPKRFLSPHKEYFRYLNWILSVKLDERAFSTISEQTEIRMKKGDNGEKTPREQGNLVTDKWSDHHHSEQRSVTRFPRTIRS